MLIHHYNTQTGEYLSSSQPDIDPRNDDRWLIPASATTEPPPPRTSVAWPFYRDGAWFLLPDYRGRICYRIDTSEPVGIDVAGRTPEDLGLTLEPRPSPRHMWIDGKWAIPPELIEREKRDAAIAEFDRLMTIARKQNAGKADAYAAGLLNDEAIYYFKAWSTYQMQLVAAIEKDTFPGAVEWPATPAPYVPPPEPVAPEGAEVTNTTRESTEPTPAAPVPDALDPDAQSSSATAPD